MLSTRLNWREILAEVRNKSEFVGSRSPIGVGDRLRGNDGGGLAAVAVDKLIDFHGSD